MKKFHEIAWDAPGGNAPLWNVLENLSCEIPNTGSLLNLGSGDAAIMERELALLKPELNVFSVDPNLHDSWYREVHMSEDYELDGLIEDTTQLNFVAAVSQELPFVDSTFDMVISHAAVPIYLPLYPTNESRDSFRKTFCEISRVLKSGGIGVMGPVEGAALERSVEMLEELGISFEMQKIENECLDDLDCYRLTIIK